MRGLTLTGRTKLQIECLMLAVHIDGYGTKLIKFCTKDSVVEYTHRYPKGTNLLKSKLHQNRVYLP